MYIKRDFSFDDLKYNCWSGAIATLKKIEEEEKEDELMNLLDELFEETPTETQVNDFLWFKDDFIFKSLNIEEEE